MSLGLAYRFLFDPVQFVIADHIQFASPPARPTRPGSQTLWDRPRRINDGFKILDVDPRYPVAVPIMPHSINDAVEAARRQLWAVFVHLQFDRKLGAVFHTSIGRLHIACPLRRETIASTAARRCSMFKFTAAFKASGKSP